MPFSKVRWITFDVGGTLLFPHPSVGEIYAEILLRHGQERDPRVLEQGFLRVWREDVRKCMPAITAESEKERWRGVISRTFHDLSDLLDIDRLFGDLWTTFREAGRWRAPEHAERILTELGERGYRLAVLSNWDERLRPLLRDVGLERHFEEIFVSCEVGFEKPDSRLFAAVEERLGAAGPEILHIGDSHHHDVLGAATRGWRAIQAFGEPAPGAGCPRVSCFTELLPLLPGRSDGPF